MHKRRAVGALVLLCLLAQLGIAGAADDAVQLRLFLRDGSSLVSYGEFARVGDRVVLSMPTAAGPNPPLQLVTLGADRVAWERTNRYAAAARAAHYLETQAGFDFAALSNQVAQTLNAVTVAKETAARLKLVENARKMLSEWPANHFNFRQTEVRQMVGMLDEAIADLQAATGAQQFAFTLSAFAEPPGIAEPLLPAPTPQEAIEGILTAARLADTPAERTALMSTAISALERDSAGLAAEWVEATRSATNAAIAVEVRLDRSYRSLTRRMMTLADRRARSADVLGIERLLARIYIRDAALGSKRPDAVIALLAAVEDKLDAARRLRLARDRWALRAPVLAEYQVAIRRSMSLFARLKPSLEGIKLLSGTSPVALVALQRSVDSIVEQASAIVPPDELRAAHALLISAAQLAENAGRIRREATLAGDMARAWDASSAAAGALLLGARARTDIQDLLRPPQLR